MTNTRAIELLKIERECINRNNQPFGKNCNRLCSKCDLVQNTEELLKMYDFVIEHFADADKMVKEQRNENIIDFVKSKKIQALEELYGNKTHKQVAKLEGALEAYNEVIEFISVEMIAKEQTIEK